jgi:hypothetical protein
MRQHAMRSLSLVAITLALPFWVEAAELSSQPSDGVRFEPKLVLEIHAKSMVGPSIQLDENNITHVAWMEEKEHARTLHYAHTVPTGEALSSPVAVNAQDEVPYWRQEAPALDAHGEHIYLVWAKMPTQSSADKPFANELRLSRSLDGGQTFLPSALINDDGELVNHSFDSIRIGREGAIHVAWIDGRGGKKTSGTYVTRSNDHGTRSTMRPASVVERRSRSRRTAPCTSHGARCSATSEKRWSRDRSTEARRFPRRSSSAMTAGFIPVARIARPHWAWTATAACM